MIVTLLLFTLCGVVPIASFKVSVEVNGQQLDRIEFPTNFSAPASIEVISIPGNRTFEVSVNNVKIDPSTLSPNGTKTQFDTAHAFQPSPSAVWSRLRSSSSVWSHSTPTLSPLKFNPDYVPYVKPAEALEFNPEPPKTMKSPETVRPLTRRPETQPVFSKTLELWSLLLPSVSRETVRPQNQHPKTEPTYSVHSQSAHAECGKRSLEHQQLRITEGFSTEPGDWPWHSAIFHTQRLQQVYKCGGTLINSDTVVTAAHCVYEFGHPIISTRILVHLGKYNIELSGRYTQKFRAHSLIIHPAYSTDTLLDDIALIRLGTAVAFTDYVRPICLWDDDRLELNTVIDKEGIAVGWGFNQFDTLSDVLNQVFMPVVSPVRCLTSNPTFFGQYITEKTFCAGFKNGSSTCNGDSGGGIYFDENGAYKLRGIVSLSKSRSAEEIFCDPMEYIVFTDVAAYLSWIRQNLA